LAQANSILWLMATGADSFYPTTEGGRRNVLVRLMHWYLNQMLVISSYNPAVYLRFLKVMHLLVSPATLLHPGVIAAVVRNALHRTPAPGAVLAYAATIDGTQQEQEYGNR
jgi:hypothetical protein